MIETLSVVWDYSKVSIVRRMRANYSLYVSIALATALPLGILLNDQLAEAQTESLLGDYADREMKRAIWLLVAMGLVVGNVQIALIVGRTIRERAGEFRLLIAVSATPMQLLALVVGEYLVHAVIGWIFGTILIVIMTLLCGTLISDFRSPTLAHIVTSSVFVLGLSTLSAIVPSSIGVAKLSFACHSENV